MHNNTKIGMSQVIRSYIFAIAVPVFTVFYSFVCIASIPLPLRYRVRTIIGWQQVVLWLAAVICRIHYRVEGLENIPHDRTGVILSKHQSAWETFYLPDLFNLTAIILKRELLWVPFFGWGLIAASPIAIDRNDKKNAMTQVLEKGKKCLAEGRWILVFPEGTRIPPGQVGKYRLGGARLAVEVGCPVVPVAHNAGRYWARRQLIKRPGVIHVVIGPVIETTGKTPEAVMQQAQDWIEGTIAKMETEVV